MSTLDQQAIGKLKAARKREGLKANSINVELRFLHRVYSLCASEWGINVKPGLTFKKLQGFAKSRYLSVQEEAMLLAHLDALGGSHSAMKAKTLAVLLMDTGMRLDEALSLSWPYVDLEARRIELYRSKTHNATILPISGRLYDLLKRVHNQPTPMEGMSRAVKVLRKAIDEVCNKDERMADLRGRATIHSLRDTFASRLVSKGMDLYPVSKLLGHKSLTMTMKYAHLQGGSVADQALKLMEE